MGPPDPYVGATNEAGKEGGKGKQSCDVANPTSPIPTDQSLLLFLTNPRQKQKSVNLLFIDCSPGVKVFFLDVMRLFVCCSFADHAAALPTERLLGHRRGTLASVRDGLWAVDGGQGLVEGMTLVSGNSFEDGSSEHCHQIAQKPWAVVAWGSQNDGSTCYASGRRREASTP